jgi:hypothetical protein
MDDLDVATDVPADWRAVVSACDASGGSPPLGAITGLSDYYGVSR